MKPNDAGKPNAKTAKRYTLTARHFYQRYLGDELPTPDNLANALRRATADYRQNSWMALRAAVAWHLESLRHTEAAKRVRSTKWPSSLEKKAPSGRPKKVSESDEIAIEAELRKRVKNGRKGAEGLYAAFLFASVLGCRPNEMPSVRDLGEGSVYIPGSKFRSEGDRGLDRVVEIRDKNAYEALRWAMAALAREPGYNHPDKLVNAIQRRWSRMTAKLFPRRKKGRPVIYSFRHQLGSDLKKDVKHAIRDRKEVAYLMGHQGTKSLKSYGDPRSARDRSAIKPAVSKQEIDSIVRETHIKDPSMVSHLEDVFYEDPLAPGGGYWGPKM